MKLDRLHISLKRLPGSLIHILLVFLIAFLASMQGVTLVEAGVSQGALLVEQDTEESITRFAIITDMGACSSPQAAVAAMVASWNPEFLVTAGDNWQGNALNDPEYCNGGGYPAAIGNYYSEFLTPGAETFWPLPGNHDYYAGIDNYLAYFHYLPTNANGNQRYYDIRRGDVHFFLLDSQEALANLADMNAQKAWLEPRLSGSNAPWKIVLLHHPPYTGGAHSPSLELRWPFAQWGADFVINGHNHIYERSLQGGIRYFTAGVAGGTQRTGSYFDGREAYYGNSSGAMRVQASENSITFEYLTSDGIVRDTFTQTQSFPTPTPTSTPTSLSPTIHISGTLVPFTSHPGAPSGEQSYTLSAANLTGSLLIQAPQYFEISTQSGSQFDSSLTLVAIDGEIASRPIYARFIRSSSGSSSGLISHTSPGAGYIGLAVSGTAVNRAPMSISLSKNTVQESLPIGTIVGVFTTTDPDSGDLFTYSLAVGPGDTDNNAFAISGSQLATAKVVDYETKSSYSIRVRSVDQGGLWVETIFTIAITETNEAIRVFVPVVLKK